MCADCSQEYEVPETIETGAQFESGIEIGALECI
jgi:hypothetical protein